MVGGGADRRRSTDGHALGERAGQRPSAATTRARWPTALECEIHELLERTRRSSLASVEASARAGQALAQAGVLDRLGRLTMDLAESLLKATAVSDLPPAVLGQPRTTRLGVACSSGRTSLRSKRRAQRRRADDRAPDGDRELEADALGGRATCAGGVGDVADAMADWREALASGCLNARIAGACSSNRGAALQETGHIDAVVVEIEDRARSLAGRRHVDAKSIARAPSSRVAGARLRTTWAKPSASAPRERWHGSGLPRGLALAHLLLAGCARRRVDVIRHLRRASRAGLDAFAALGIAEATTQRLAAAPGGAWSRWMTPQQRCVPACRSQPSSQLERADLHAELRRGLPRCNGDVDRAPVGGRSGRDTLRVVRRGAQDASGWRKPCRRMSLGDPRRRELQSLPYL